MSENLQLELTPPEADWVLMAVRDERFALRKKGNEAEGEILLGVIRRIVAWKDKEIANESNVPD